MCSKIGKFRDYSAYLTLAMLVRSLKATEAAMQWKNTMNRDSEVHTSQSIAGIYDFYNQFV